MAYTKEEVGKATFDIVRHIMQHGEGTEEEFLTFIDKKALLDKALALGNQANSITRIVTPQDNGQLTVRWKLMNPDRWRGKDPTFILNELLDVEPASKLVYKDYVELPEATLVLDYPSLSGNPGADGKSLVWPRIQRNGTEVIWLRAKHFQAWLMEGARYAGCSDKVLQAIKKFYVHFENVEFPISTNGTKPANGSVTLESSPVVAPAGKGIIPTETLPVGTRIPIRIRYPSSVVDPADLINALNFAAEMVGFSPARHKEGYGRGHMEFIESGSKINVAKGNERGETRSES